MEFKKEHFSAVPLNIGRPIGDFMKKQKKRRPGNIQAEAVFDPFPKAGLIKEYEPFIRARARDFVFQYPHVTYEEALVEAVKLAHDAELTSSPSWAINSGRCSHTI
jgi:hypothetical protein